MKTLEEMAVELSVGANVTAKGVDTRGHSVTRTGVLLAEPKNVKAQRNGTPTAAVRVSVGTSGEDSTARSTWVTLFPDTGSVELAEVNSEWRNEPLGNVPGVRAGNHDIRVLFGGKGGKRSAEPSMSEPAGVTYTGDGKYEVWAAESGDVLHTCALAGRVWWKPVPKVSEPEQQDQVGAEAAPAVEATETVAASRLPDVREWARAQGYQVSDRGRVPAKVQVAFQMAYPQEADGGSFPPAADILAPEPVKMVGQVPENTLYMAEHADTEAARAWWQRRVESYSQPVTA
ncbi:hypothetical protein BGM09_10355 [Streptomyces sp. CBMA29]|nr:hypothetical protein [Streptomyces sp. CBMA29]